MTVTFTGEIHPYAAVFPMLVEDDLDALAEDIKANGLQSPIVLDAGGVLVDGRNRLAACERAGVEPTFTVLVGDPVAFIVSANLQRRDLTAGMKAYYAVASLEVSKLETRGTTRNLARISGVPESRIAEALVVARYAPDHFTLVLAGDMKPAIAYERATGIKADLDQAEKRRAELTKLQAVPDHPPLEFDAALAQVRAAYHRDLADATDESELQRAHDELLARGRKISGICTDLIDRRIRESQFINRVLRAYGHNLEE